MLDLVTGGHGTLGAISMAVIAIIAGVWRVFRAGRQIESGKAAKQANKIWSDTNDIIGRATKARRDARKRADAGGLYDDDGFKRP